MVSRAMHWEASSVDAGAIEKAIEEIHEKYQSVNIFNVDETALFYELLPRYVYLSNEDGWKTATGNEDT